MRRRRRAVIAAKARRAGPGDGGDDALRVYLPDPVMELIRNVQAAVRSYGHIVWSDQICLRCWPAVSESVGRGPTPGYGRHDGTECFGLDRGPVSSV